MALLSILACQAPARDHVPALLASTGNTPATPHQFFVCSGHGCKERSKITLSESEWESITAHFSPQVHDAVQERVVVARAVGSVEEIVGGKNGTSKDKGGTFEGAFARGQLDCEDESLNTALYISLFERAGFLRFHEGSVRARRGYFINGWPHMTATIAERATGDIHVVDSWFADNGRPAFVVPLAQWKAGARPE